MAPLKSVSNVRSIPVHAHCYASQARLCFSPTAVDFHNQFDGARLNGVTQINDSVYSVRITPRMSPSTIAPTSPLPSIQPPKPYLRFDYPKGYTHRYVPKQNWGEGWNITPKEYLTLVDSITQLRLNEVYGEDYRCPRGSK